jgi:signal transduction histidine kinase/ligand-binding sensor domain-containing protein/DNA-binding response OmpR family regulator
MKVSAIACLVVLLLLGIDGKVYSQSISYIGIEQGLSNNTVTVIYKDRSQLMWFGTLDGLNRWDGHSIRQFRSRSGDPASLPSDKITALTEDRSGDLWVGTEKGIGILDNRVLQCSPITYIPCGERPGKEVPFDGEVKDISSDSKGNIYIGSSEAGLLLCEKGSHTAIQVHLSDHGSRPGQYTVNAIAIDDDDNVWLLLNDYGLYFYDRRTKAVTAKGGGFPSANCMQRDEKGNLWIGTKKGLFFYNVRTAVLGKFELKDKELNNSIIRDIRFDKDRQLWLATDGDGIGVIDVFGAGAYRVFRQGRPGTLSSDAISRIYEDERSLKWIGTFRGGIDVIDNRASQFTTIAHDPYNRNSLVNNFAFSFCEDARKQLWIGTDGGGISVWNRAANTFSHYIHTDGDGRGLSNNHVTSIVRDDLQRIWIGTFGGGVNRFNKTAGTFENIPFEKCRDNNSAVWKLYIDGEKTIWASCLKGDFPGVKQDRLYQFDERANLFKPVPFPLNTDVISMAEDDTGHLWLGTFKGLLYLNKKDGSTRSYGLNTTVRALHKDSRGRLWVGTFGKGLFCYNRNTDHFSRYTEDNGLCNNTVLNIEEDEKGNIWVSTYNGLSRLNPSTGRFENFYAGDGLQSNQFYYNASTRLESGEIAFGGIKGFNIFHPDSIREWRDFPPILITALRVSNTPVNAASDYCRDAESLYGLQHIRLPYDRAVISLDYVAPEYSAPEKIQYAYYLTGWDRSWNYVNRLNTVSYPQLREGEYVLKIKSTNAAGEWNPKERLVYITVLPPWYRTWWAYLLYGMLAAGLISGGLFYHRKQLRLRYEVKFTRELNEKKIAFFTNISHELRAPLTLIAGPIKELIHNKHSELVDMPSVYRNTQRMLSLVDQLLLFKAAEDEVSALRVEKLNLTEVCREVFLCFNNQLTAHALQAEFRCEEDIHVCADREKIEIVLFNLLSNAIKFTPDGGSIHLGLSGQGENVEIVVGDSGRGIPEGTGARLFEKFYRVKEENETAPTTGFGIGLFLVRRYVDLHHGEISYTSRLNQGTVFRISLPKGEIQELHLPGGQAEKEVAGATLLTELMVEPAADLSSGSDGDMRQLAEDVVTEKPVILVIDDDAELRRYIRQLLKDAYIVYEAENAEKGLEIALEAEPDVVVCDVVMPGMNGVEFCTKMKELPALNHIPVLLLTSSSSPEIKLKGIECGADDFITKPFESGLLVARIRSIIKGRDTLKQYFLNEITLQGNSMKVPEEYSEFLSKCIALIEEHIDDEEFSMAVFTREMCMSRWKLSKKVKSISGLSMSEFVRYIRLRKAAQLMIQTNLQIKEIIFRVGIQDVKYFREQFSRLFGMNPSEFIRKYRGTYIKKNNIVETFETPSRGVRKRTNNR